MTAPSDRVGELVDGVVRRRRALLSPEGVLLDVQIAGHGERLAAFAVDMLCMLAAIVCLYALIVLFMLSDISSPVSLTLVLFLSFIVRTAYFLHFELAWQGSTPGKKACGLRVINRNGGELTPAAVIARNLTREAEVFLPLSLLFSMPPGSEAWPQIALFCWALCLTSLPFCNSARLRPGDLIGGTQVIAMPRRALLDDLSLYAADALPRRPEAAQPLQSDPAGRYVFTHEQLAIYGTLELQVLEEFLRRPKTPETHTALRTICEKICRKISWGENVPETQVRRFLTDFYTAERGELERGQLFGQHKEDQTVRPDPR